MKVLLLNSPWIQTDTEYCVKAGTRWAAVRKRDRSMPYFPFPDYLASAAAVLKEAGFDAHIKDAVAEEMTRGECLAYVERCRPDLLVIEAFTPSIYEDLSFMQEAKARTGCRSVFCGAHATALPAEILQHEHMDFVLAGEFEYTLRELVRFLSQGRRDVEHIAGLAFKEQNQVRINPRRALIQDLDELPFPETDELPMRKYNEPFSKHFPNARIITSRGCPYTCIFCVEQIMCGIGQSYRKRSLARVVEEIKHVRDTYGAREIFFDDAIFTITRAKEVAAAFVSDNLRLPWSCWIDWNITFADLKLLKRSGCVGVKFGVESANRDILATARKPVQIEKIKELIKNCRKLGILRHGSFMLGLPGETKETLRSTIDLAFSLDLTSSQIGIATPLPGTPLYAMAQEHGWLATKDWRKYECFYSAVLKYPDCGPDDILAAMELARRKKVRQVLRNPLIAARYVINLYRIKGLRGFCREMTRRIAFVFKALFSQR